MARQGPAKRAYQQWREAVRRGDSYVPGSPEAAHASRVARFWRERYRQLAANVVPETKPVAIRRYPSNDPWFEADVGLAFESVSSLEAPVGRLVEEVQSQLRRTYPGCLIVPKPPGPHDPTAVLNVYREGLSEAEGRVGRAELPQIRAFPRDDVGFLRHVEETLRELSGPDAASGPILRDLLQAGLRARYPCARVVEQTSLAHIEGPPVWYAYREGHALPVSKGSSRKPERREC